MLLAAWLIPLIITIAVSIIGGLLWLDRYIHDKSERRADEMEQHFSASLEARCAKVETQLSEREKQTERLRDQLAKATNEFWEYRVLAAERFATVQSLSAMRKEMLDALSGVNEKLDRLIERK